MRLRRTAKGTIFLGMEINTAPETTALPNRLVFEILRESQLSLKRGGQ